jgi:hypothetical protein
MATEKEFELAVQDLQENKDRTISLAEVVAKVLKGRIVEIYVGDRYEDIKYDDSTVCYPAVLVGKVITAFKECLVLNCAYIDQKTKKIQFGNIICLNERAIRFLTEVDETGVLKDTFINSRDSKIVKDLFKGK